VNIARRLLTVTATGVNKIYNGAVKATVTYSDDRLAGDVLTISGRALFIDKNVGVGKTVNVSRIRILGTDARNYMLAGTTATTTANITAKALTVTGLTAMSKLFDGTTAATLMGTAKLLAVIRPGTGTGVDGRPYAGDGVVLVGPPVGTFNNAAIGYMKPVTVSGLSLTGAGAGNYTLTPPPLTASIFDPNDDGDDKRL
jgi:hypothetical protein